MSVLFHGLKFGSSQPLLRFPTWMEIQSALAVNSRTVPSGGCPRWHHREPTSFHQDPVLEMYDEVSLSWFPAAPDLGQCPSASMSGSHTDVPTSSSVADLVGSTGRMPINLAHGPIREEQVGVLKRLEWDGRIR
jgi:hypothetical protein